MRLIAFDLETTGLDVQNDRIMEFSFLEVDASLQPIGDPWTALVDPGVPISKQVQDVTGITPDMVTGKAPFSHHAARIQRLVGDATLIAHNGVRFDIPFLHHELVRAGEGGLAPDHPCIDTFAIEGYVNSNALDAAYQRYTGQVLQGGHRSEADVAATIAVLRGQLRKYHEMLGDDPGTLTQDRIEQLRNPGSTPRKYLDHKRCFYEDADGTVRFGFTKENRDKPVLENEGLLRWMSSRDFPPDTKALVERFLAEIAERAK